MSTVPAHEPTALWRRVIAPPSTRAGRRSAWLTGGVIGLLALVGGLVTVGVADWGWGAQLVLGLSSVTGVVSAIVAGVIAVAAIVRGERSIVVLGPLLFGLFCAAFVIGEFRALH